MLARAVGFAIGEKGRVRVCCWLGAQCVRADESAPAAALTGASPLSKFMLALWLNGSVRERVEGTSVDARGNTARQSHDMGAAGSRDAEQREVQARVRGQTM